jgi:NOL1/NOP2/fmu family ribosome biogenesis protein
LETTSFRFVSSLKFWQLDCRRFKEIVFLKKKRKERIKNHRGYQNKSLAISRARRTGLEWSYNLVLIIGPETSFFTELKNNVIS